MLSILLYFTCISLSLMIKGSTFRISHEGYTATNQTYKRMNIEASKLKKYYTIQYMLSSRNVSDAKFIKDCEKYCCKDEHCKMFVIIDKFSYKLMERNQKTDVQTIHPKHSNETYKVYIKLKKNQKCAKIKGLDTCSLLNNRLFNYAGHNKGNIEMSFDVETFINMQHLLDEIISNTQSQNHFSEHYSQCRSFINNYLCYKSAMLCGSDSALNKSISLCSIPKNTISQWCNEYTHKILQLYPIQSTTQNMNCFNLLPLPKGKVFQDNVSKNKTSKNKAPKKIKHKTKRMLISSKHRPVIKFIPANHTNELQKGLNSINYDNDKQWCEKMCGNRGKCILGDNMDMKCACHWPYYFNNPLQKQQKQMFCELNLWTVCGVTMLILSICSMGALVIRQRHLARMRANSQNGSVAQKILNFVSDDPNSNKFALFTSADKSSSNQYRNAPSIQLQPLGNKNNSSSGINQSMMYQMNKDKEEIVLYDRNQMLSNLQQLSMMNRKKLN